MTDEIKKAAIRRYNAQQMMIALNHENAFGKTREQQEEQAYRYAMAEHELHEANKEYERLVKP